MTSSKSLLFTMKLATDADKIDGQLIAYDNVKCKVDQIYTATSGYVHKQGWECQDDSESGLIPQCNQVNLDHYTLNPNPIYVSDYRIQGDFFGIDPTSVDIWGTPRGNFGIYFEDHIPAKPGCITIGDPDEWTNFKVMMSHYRIAGLVAIPLVVSYTR